LHFFANLFGGTLPYHRYPCPAIISAERRSPQKMFGEQRPPAFTLDYSTADR